jgi:NTP pyrophosphatase (non-canonical NTP hydrolase)
MKFTFEEFSQINKQRCERWHPGFPNDGWTGADWSNAMCGEAGEAANVVKKLRRLETGLFNAVGPDKDILLQKLADEIGDVVTYLDLLAHFYGLNLAECATAKFNAVSEREGLPERMPT